MIVRDAGAAWHVVLQPEHAELSEEVARAWADRGPRHDSVVLAARRHDDGWATWERSPMVDADGKPVTFLDVHVPAHLAFYRAVIAAVTDEDAYAGLLVSMHGAGIYRQRYGADPALALTRAPEVQALVDAFVAEQESGFPARMDEVECRRRAAPRRLPPAAVVRPVLARVLPARVGQPGGAASRSDRSASSPSGRGAAGSCPGRSPARRSSARSSAASSRSESWRQEGFRDAFYGLPAERVTIGLVE